MNLEVIFNSDNVHLDELLPKPNLNLDFKLDFELNENCFMIVYKIDYELENTENRNNVVYITGGVDYESELDELKESKYSVRFINKILQMYEHLVQPNYNPDVVNFTLISIINRGTLEEKFIEMIKSRRCYYEYF